MMVVFALVVHVRLIAIIIQLLIVILRAASTLQTIQVLVAVALAVEVLVAVVLVAVVLRVVVTQEVVAEAILAIADRQL
jgi:hypothetical protein